jgi:type IV pilus assembly protein PilW
MPLYSSSDMNTRTTSSRQTGVTLIELLVALAVGLVILGAVLTLYSANSSSRNQSVAMAEMAEDGTYALRTLSRHIRLAGFNPFQPGRDPIGTATFSLYNPPHWGTSTLPIFGCSSAFTAPERGSGTFAATSINLLTCDASNTASHAIAVTYEADTFNTVPTTTGNTPTDCIGSGLQMQTRTENGRAFNYFYVENRFYVKDNSLYCVGNGGNVGAEYAVPAQPLVANVEQIFFSYGVATTTVVASTSTTTVSTRPIGYLSGSAIGDASGIDNSSSVDSNLQTLDATVRWGRVNNVRICVLMRTSTQVLTDPQPYIGCDPTQDAIVPTDRFARRAFVSTVALRNTGGR